MAQTRAKTVINLLQAPPPPEPRQILLQVKFAAIDRVALTQIGFNLFSTNPKLIGAASTEQFAAPRFSQLQPTSDGQTVNFSDLLNLFAFRPDLNIGATIKALQEHNLLQILAEPNLLALEGKDATFLAGGSFPFPTITTTPTGGATAPVITVQFKPFGVKLDFTPTVTPQGSIDLKVDARSQQPGLRQRRHPAGLPDSRAQPAPRRNRGHPQGRRELRDRRTDRQPRDRDHLQGSGPRRSAHSRQALPQPQHAEIRRRTAGGGHAALRQAADPGREGQVAGDARDVPAGRQAARSRRAKGKKTSSKASSTDPEFVGPRGQQIPKQ